jgi:crossover junction endodeoxyribonuclease RuvC
MIILGIDPGLTHTGIGLIRAEGNNLRFIHSTRISPPVKAPLEVRLKTLHDAVQQICESFHPDIAAIEETFVNVNGQSTLKLGQARGALLLSLCIAGLSVHEYAARLVKKTLTGNGAAQKEQVAMMVQTLLPGSLAATPDAADALAIAITHAQHAPLVARLAAQ